MARRPKPHQQPGWSINGCSYSGLPVEPIRWEKFLLSEHIAEEDVRDNPKVLKFVKEHAERFYVPTKVLKMYGMDFEL